MKNSNITKIWQKIKAYKNMEEKKIIKENKMYKKPYIYINQVEKKNHSFKNLSKKAIKNAISSYYIM